MPEQRAAVAATDDLVVLVDEARRPVATMPRSEVHSATTPLHLAFSVYLFDRAGRFLVTRRALGKTTWPGVWSNSCCGHVRPTESSCEATERRVVEELSLTPEPIELVLPDFSYRAVSPEGLVEHEVCPVFVGLVDGDPSPDPAEVAQWRWVDWPQYCAAVESAPWLVSPWAAMQTPLVRTALESRRAG